MHRQIIAFSLLSLFAISGTAFALNWNDPGVTPVQSISDHRWRDAATGRLINVTGMPGTTTGTKDAGATAASATGATAVSAGTSTVATAEANAVNTAARSGNRYIQGLKSAPSNFKNLPTVKAKIFKGLGVLGGGLLVYQGTVGSGPHSWGDVVSGALGGLTAGASVGSLTGPAYPFVVAGATIVGAAVGGAKFFSESGGDCVYDPILMGGDTVYTCCNTVFNKGMRWVGPGGTMFCEMPDGSPGVHTCLNGGSTTTDSMWKQDEWSDCQETDTMWCPGVSKPTDDNGVVYIPTLAGLQTKVAQQQTSKIQGVTPQSQTLTEDELKNVSICWDWNCDTELGFYKDGNICAYGKTNDTSDSGTDATTASSLPDPYDVIIKRIQAEIQRITNQCGYMMGTLGNI